MHMIHAKGLAIKGAQRVGELCVLEIIAIEAAIMAAYDIKSCSLVSVSVVFQDGFAIASIEFEMKLNSEGIIAKASDILVRESDPLGKAYRELSERIEELWEELQETRTAQLSILD